MTSDCSRFYASGARPCSHVFLHAGTTNCTTPPNGSASSLTFGGGQDHGQEPRIAAASADRTGLGFGACVSRQRGDLTPDCPCAGRGNARGRGIVKTCGSAFLT